MFTSVIMEVKQTACEKFRLFLIALMTTDNWMCNHIYFCVLTGKESITSAYQNSHTTTKPYLDDYTEILNEDTTPGPGCSKLTTSLVNGTLKIRMLISQYANIFC